MTIKRSLLFSRGYLLFLHDLNGEKFEYSEGGKRQAATEKKSWKKSPFMSMPSFVLFWDGNEMPNIWLVLIERRIDI